MLIAVFVLEQLKLNTQYFVANKKAIFEPKVTD